MNNYLKEILYLLGEDKLKLVPLVFLFLLTSIFDLIGLGLIGPYIALVVSPEIIIDGKIGSLLSKIGFNLEVNNLIVIFGLILVTVFLIKSLSSIYVASVIEKFTLDKITKLRKYLMHAYQELSYVDLLKRNSSEFVNAIGGFTAHYGAALRSLMRILSDAIIAVVILILLAYTSMQALLIMIVLFGCTFVIYDIFIRRKSVYYGEQVNVASEKMMRGIHEGVEGFKEVRILNKSSFFQKILENASDTLAYNLFRMEMFLVMPRYILEVVLVTFIVTFIITSLMIGISVTVLIPTIGVFGVAGLRLAPMVNQLMSSINQLRYVRNSVSQIYNDIQGFNYKVDKKNNTIKDDKTPGKFHQLVLESISFRYPNIDNLAVDNINIEIKAGESIGFIGPSGSGKTTIVNILLGLLEPQKGRILFNNTKLDLNTNMSEWRSNIAYLPQDIFLIDNTLCRNVALGIDDSEIDETKVLQSLKQARLEEFLSQLPKGIHTKIGERGMRLSGGQRQRVALARAFYHGRNILVMDESTSSLDHETEQQIVDEIKHLKRKKTIVVIAHRLTTVQHCDRIYRLRNGKIEIQGKYEEVVNTKIRKSLPS